MSTVTFLLLSLQFLGFSETHVLEYEASGGPGFYVKSPVDSLGNEPDDSSLYATGMIFEWERRLRRDRTNRTSLALLFAEDFVMYGCYNEFPLDTFLNMLIAIPSSTPIKFIFQGSEFNSNREVVFYVVVKGLTKVSFAAEFKIRIVGRILFLFEGHVLSCPNTRHFALESAVKPLDGSELIAEPFHRSLINLITANDQKKLSALITDRFRFVGCKRDYNKQKTLTLLSALANKTNFSMTFLSSQWISADAEIQYIVVASGFGVPDFQIQLILKQVNGIYVLIFGRVPECPARHLSSF